MNKLENIFSKNHGLSMASGFKDNNGEYVDVCSVQSAAEISKDLSTKFAEWIGAQHLELYLDINTLMWADEYDNKSTTEALFILFIEKVYDSI